jgi:hypothetical protein
MQTVEILATLKQLGITAYTKGDRLICEPGSKLPPDLKPEIREHKAEIVGLLLRGQSAPRSVVDMQSLLGRDVAVGFYKPPGKGQPKVPLNGLGTTVLEASGLCSPDCDHEFGAHTSEEVSDGNRH